MACEFLKKTSIALIRLYQRGIGRFLPRVCRFHPSCSEYMALSIGYYGFLRGVLRGLYRILRCTPLSSGGFDAPYPGWSSGDSNNGKIQLADRLQERKNSGKNAERLAG